MTAEVSPVQFAERRETVFLCLAGFFLCSMTLLNVVGITKFVQLGPIGVAVGVLPYPLTFLCTDLVSELYGKRRANKMVTLGLVLNFFILGVLWLGNSLPGAEQPAPWQLILLAEDLVTPSGQVISDQVELFQIIYATTSGAVFASMLAYVAAQYIDVRLFHFWRNLTQGRHLWLRNNMSTLVSQAIDSVVVITVTFGVQFMAGNIAAKAFLGLMLSNYLFKLLAALADTPIAYLLIWRLRPYLGLRANEQVDLLT